MTLRASWRVAALAGLVGCASASRASGVEPGPVPPPGHVDAVFRPPRAATPIAATPSPAPAPGRGSRSGAAAGSTAPPLVHAAPKPVAVGPLWLTHDADGRPFDDPASITAELPPGHVPGELRELQPIEDPHRALVPFYEVLARTDASVSGAITRVTHLGDSSIGHDTLPHAIRRRMQARFGDGGAGFVLVDRYIRNVDSKVMEIHSNDAWEICYIRNRCDADGHYGLGGHIFESDGGAASWLSPRSGRSATTSRVELWHAALPGGGLIGLRIDDGELEQIDTDADGLEDRWHTVQTEPGPHRIEVSAQGGGSARVYGLVLETDGPGVVWDSVSMYGAFTKRLRGLDAEHIAQQLEHRDPDLLVLSYGGNDLRRLVSGSVAPEQYAEEYEDVLARLRASRSSLPCLMIGVIDHGRSGTYTVPPEAVETMIQTQREIAYAQGCAFFDTVAAMGGAGSLRRWLELDPPLAQRDLKHLSAEGSRRIGALIYRALVAGYESYRHARD